MLSSTWVRLTADLVAASLLTAIMLVAAAISTDLYGRQDFAELPPPDGLHLDAAGYWRVGERFARLAFSGPFS